MALKPAEFYGNKLAVANKLPPGSSQAKHYTTVAEMVMEMLLDAEIDPMGTKEGVPNPMITSMGPVTGSGKIRGPKT